MTNSNRNLPFKDLSTNCQTFRNGTPRESWHLERLARHRAAKLGYRLHRSRRRKGPDNAGEFVLIHKASSTVLLGAGYTATLASILEFLEREVMAISGADSPPKGSSTLTPRQGTDRSTDKGEMK